MKLLWSAVVERLQDKNPFRRRLLLTHYLRDLGVSYQEQEFALDYQANIRVDIPEEPVSRIPRQLISGYYDEAGSAPHTAVLLGLVEHYALTMEIPCLLRFLFLDAHDGHPSGLETYALGQKEEHPFHLHLDNVDEKAVCYFLNGALQCQIIKDDEHYLESAVNVLWGMIKWYSQGSSRQIQQSRGRGG